MALHADDPIDYLHHATALSGMGLDAELMREAARKARIEVDDVTGNDAENWPQLVMWDKLLRHLAEELAALGVSRDRAEGLEFLAVSDPVFRIVPVRGDRATGTSRMPRTGTKRGPLTAQAVDLNFHQLRLDEHSNVRSFKRSDEPSIWVWTLLHYFDAAAEELRLELSRPVERTSLGGDNRCHLIRFEPRFHLEPIDLAERTEERAAGDEDDDGGEDIDIEVRRKP